MSFSTRSKPTAYNELINNFPFISKSIVPTADIKINGVNLFCLRFNNLARHSAQFLADPPALIFIVPILELFMQLSKFLLSYIWEIMSIADPPIININFSSFY